MVSPWFGFGLPVGRNNWGKEGSGSVAGLEIGDSGKKLFD